MLLMYFFHFFSFQVIMATYFFTTHVTDKEKQRLNCLISKKYEHLNGCYIWKGASPKGYGVLSFSFRGKKFKLKAHRVVYYLGFNQPLSPKMHVSHVCHNKLCVNIQHLSYEPQKINNNRQICAHEGICYGHYGFLDCKI